MIVTIEHPRIGKVVVPHQHIRAYLRLGDLKALDSLIATSRFFEYPLPSGSVVERSNEFLKMIHLAKEEDF